MRKVKLRAGQYYHIYNRGVDRQPIFFVEAHWRLFIGRLRKYFLPEYVSLIAYCLMPNHYHLLVQLHTDTFGDNVMQPFSVSFTKTVNRDAKRVGPLFQGPFQAKLVAENRYLLHLSSYIHLNPVVAGLVKEPGDWLYSSYRDYTSQRNGTLPKPKIILSQFDSIAQYEGFVQASVREAHNSVRHLLFAE